MFFVFYCIALLLAFPIDQRCFSHLVYSFLFLCSHFSLDNPGMHVLSPAQHSLMRAGVHATGTLDEASLFILKNGWTAATTRQYAAAINKFLRFLDTTKERSKTLPYSEKSIYHFMMWCSTRSDKLVSSSTIRRYLTGLRMWHVLHDMPFPTVDPNRVRLLLKSCKITELSPTRRERVGLTLQDMVDLTDKITTDNTHDLVAKSVILIGFWSLARLGELTRHEDHPDVFIRRKDVFFSRDGKSAHIRLRLAKTAQPGETQLLRLKAQPNRLDPLNTLHELLTCIPGEPGDPLFPGRTHGKPIEKAHIVSFLAANGPQDQTRWGGHSLRIGGASFQRASGRSISSLKRLGRWKSSAYKSYVRRYSPVLRGSTKDLAKAIHF